MSAKPNAQHKLRSFGRTYDMAWLFTLPGRIGEGHDLVVVVDILVKQEPPQSGRGRRPMASMRRCLQDEIIFITSKEIRTT